MDPHLIEPLTRRELEILAQLASGHSNAEIAASLSLALSSIKWYAQQIYTKLGVGNRKQALQASRAVLGTETFAAAWQEGRSLTETQVMQLAAQLPLENIPSDKTV